MEGADLQGYQIVVAGGASRLGGEISRGLAKAGANIVIHYHSSESAAESLADEIIRMGRKAIAVKADLTQYLEIKKLRDTVFSKFGRIDALINNAGIIVKTPFFETSGDTWDRVINLNLKGVYFTIQLFAEKMMVQEGGAIVNIADISGIKAWRHYSIYSLAKAGLISMTQSLSVELAPKIRINSISPGIILFSEDISAEEKQRLIQKIPLKRTGTPEDIISALIFLLHPNRFMTGQNLSIDGGRLQV